MTYVTSVGLTKETLAIEIVSPRTGIVSSTTATGRVAIRVAVYPNRTAKLAAALTSLLIAGESETVPSVTQLRASMKLPPRA